MKPRCDWCSRPSEERYLVFAKGDDPPPERRASSAVGLVCLACRDFLKAHPEKAGLPRSCRREALEEFAWGPLRETLAALDEAPDFEDSEEEVFGGLR